MEKKPELEWAEVQRTAISQDLVAAAIQQLRFLAEVDCNRCLYDGPVLYRAIFRYNYCWLPLLAKHALSPDTEDPLVGPLDCEWIWHCHRLNPVSRPYMNDKVFLEGAVARYKGFLHLIKRNSERPTRLFCVPTYDIDLIWHSHQRHPASYCKDLMALMGKVLEHDDTDSDRTKGQELDRGFSGTTKKWEATFGSRYQKA
ncbi:Glycine-rich domain-containing protein-like [Quillaja saponaria]|uniref:Glycine-rich domain-containing protein-like n=1 Tax=Quillaja saponaria TaxID=32244 RepID=A0AAD7LZC7_QUISA|nr:Glycine-rich domain-containing protein-like [Quillaja saponaria]